MRGPSTSGICNSVSKDKSGATWKTRQSSSLITDLEETFANIRHLNIK
jgi:hypothetical protein